MQFPGSLASSWGYVFGGLYIEKCWFEDGISFWNNPFLGDIMTSQFLGGKQLDQNRYG